MKTWVMYSFPCVIFFCVSQKFISDLLKFLFGFLPSVPFLFNLIIKLLHSTLGRIIAFEQLSTKFLNPIQYGSRLSLYILHFTH